MAVSTPLFRRKAATIGFVLAFLVIVVAAAIFMTGAMRPVSNTAMLYHGGQVAAEWGANRSEWG